MASSLPTISCSLNTSTHKHRASLKLKQPQVRCQSFKDEGKSEDMVEANLSVLRRRIEEVKKKKESSSSSLNEQCCSCRHKNGWNYQRVYYDHHHRHKHKKITDRIISESIQILGSVSGAVGFVFLTGSLFIFLFSFLVHSF
ncbi:uncharacterized protein LOC123215025 [Mangifera indica]|uniref:uncharacterized protein LOC123215025 n=1 Tax=Mangifera indica TaxID=29780 RepID=UPI001CF96912|nr:uncharacterized protein LOC123215025 [Mangifera indica]